MADGDGYGSPDPNRRFKPWCWPLGAVQWRDCRPAAPPPVRGAVDRSRSFRSRKQIIQASNMAMKRNCLAHEPPGPILGCTDDETKPATKVLPENMAQLGRPLPFGALCCRHGFFFLAEISEISEKTEVFGTLR
jgi:hypothetical protein